MSCIFKQEMDAKKGPSEQACYQKPDLEGARGKRREFDFPNIKQITYPWVIPQVHNNQKTEGEKRKMKVLSRSLECGRPHHLLWGSASASPRQQLITWVYLLKWRMLWTEESGTWIPNLLLFRPLGLNTSEFHSLLLIIWYDFMIDLEPIHPSISRLSLFLFSPCISCRYWLASQAVINSFLVWSQGEKCPHHIQTRFFSTRWIVAITEDIYPKAPSGSFNKVIPKNMSDKDMFKPSCR